MKNELDIVRDVSEKLNRLQIPFMLTGSMAMNLYGMPRMTRDIDIVLEITSGDVERLLDGFEPEYITSPESVRSAISKNSRFNMIHKEAVIKVDCIVRKQNEHAQEEFARRRSITVKDIHTAVVTKEDLILAKLRWAQPLHSEVQLRDVKSLLATGYNEEYVEAWARKLGLSELLQECKRG